MEKKQEFLTLFDCKGIYGKIKDVSFDDFQKWTSSEAPSSLDLHCPKCQENKTFVKGNCDASGIFGNFWRNGWQHGMRGVVFSCPTCNEQIYYSFLYNNDCVIKLAQYPSLYDVSRDELKKYKKNDLIDKESFAEIYKAEICASENYYIASYTYMRRVYENMLLNVFTHNIEEIGITEEEFRKLRSDEKMERIKPFLAIDEEIYKPLYALLSAGIHSLTEDECCQDYSLLKSILLDILAEQKAKKERELKRKEIQDLYSKKKSETQ